MLCRSRRARPKTTPADWWSTSSLACRQKFGRPDLQYAQVPSTLPLGLTATLWPIAHYANVVAYCRDPAGGLVSEDAVTAVHLRQLGGVQIAAANAAEIDFDQDLVGSQRRGWPVL
jgi:hypothetical protein